MLPATVKQIEELVAIPSPSGYTTNIISLIKEVLEEAGYSPLVTNKGALLVSLSPEPLLVVSAHIDTLGGMVKRIKDDGTLEITEIGGYPLNSFEGEYLTVRTQKDVDFRGTFLLNNPAAHVNREVGKAERKLENMHIRLDAEVRSREDVEKLGISVGDFVFFDPRFEYTETGFVKSRFMDDKACAGIFMDILLNHYEEIDGRDVAFYFSNYEEVGHGAAAGLPPSAKEMLVADMGVVGEGVAGDEFSVSICAKDSTGPYDYEMRRKLVELAEENEIPYRVDVFPYYGSDGSAALRAGQDLRVGLIGPGVSASHGVERTHEKGIMATEQLILAYIKTL